MTFKAIFQALEGEG